MKNSTKKLLAAFLTFALLFTSVVTLMPKKATQVNALDDETNSAYTIYTFYDYYPEFSQSQLEAEFGSSYNYVFELCNFSNFEHYVQLGYFYGLGTNCVVVFDIKLNLPNAMSFEEVLFDLKSNQNCSTAVITTFSISCFDTLYIDFYIDNLVNNYNKLYTYYSQAMNHFSQLNNLTDCVILVDPFIVSLDTLLFDNITPLCEDSVAIRLLLQVLLVELKALEADLPIDDRIYESIESDEYEQIAQILVSRGVKILIAYQNNIFIDILTHDVYTLENGQEFCVDEYEINFYTNVCVLSFSHMSMRVYNIIDSVRNSNEDGLFMPWYVLETEPIIYVEGGVPVYVYPLLEDETSGGVNSMWADFVGWINSLEVSE